MAERVSEMFDMPSPELWIPGKHRWRVRAKSVLCYWANRELEVSMSELSRRMNVSVMAISHAVQRGAKTVKELNISFSQANSLSLITTKLRQLRTPMIFPSKF